MKIIINMKFLLLWVSSLTIILCEEEYQGYDPTGGVSATNKIKTVDLFKMDNCGLVSDEGDTIHWNYKGTFLSGKVFDQGKFTATLGQHQVIKGVDIGMRGMCVGDKKLMTIYYDWAYGDAGTQGIPPKSNLRFEVELTGIDRLGIGSETIEDVLKRTGGVSMTQKLKVEDLFKIDPEQCSMQSREHDTIHWHYKGTFLDGKVFDEGTFTATLGHHQVITGVDLGMRGLCVGDKRKMIIHPAWGYGERGVKNVIPPNSVLVFEVVLKSIERPDGTKDQQMDDTEEKDNMGGVSKKDKLKIDITHEVKDCPLRSKEDDTIQWHYVGTFLDGSEFHRGNFKATLGHGHVIEGVDRGMRDMCVGDKRRITIHPDWAYGEHGRPGSIPPNSVLVFDVEMTNINRPDPRKGEL